VVRADGRLGGYGWGVPRKCWLLGHESTGWGPAA
jgi:O6-methylguanine-DNA--protein-cysteine methyltransferase